MRSLRRSALIRKAVRERPVLAHSLRPAYSGFVRVFARPAGVGISGIRRIF